MKIEPLSIFSINGVDVVLPLGGEVDDFAWFKVRTENGWSMFYRRLFLLEDFSTPLGVLNESEVDQVLTSEVSRIRSSSGADAS